MLTDRARRTIVGLAAVLAVGIAVAVVGFALTAIDAATGGASGGGLERVGWVLLIGGAAAVVIAALALLAIALRLRARDRAGDG